MDCQNRTRSLIQLNVLTTLTRMLYMVDRFINHKNIPQYVQYIVDLFHYPIGTVNLSVFPDLNQMVSLGADIYSLWSHSARQKHSGNVNAGNDYIGRLSTMLTNRNVFQRAVKLENSVIA